MKHAHSGQRPASSGARGAARLLLLLLALATAFAGACKNQDNKPLTIGYSDWPGWVAWQIAIEKGMFEKRGVKVEFRWFDNYVESLQAMDAKQLDGNCQTWNDTLFSLATVGNPVKVVLVNDNSAGNDGVAVRSEINSIADLRGKVVAAEEGTVSHFVLMTALAKNGLKPEDVQFKNMFVPDAANALTLGNVQAAALWQPSLANSLSGGGVKLLFSSKEMPGLIPDLLVFHENVVATRADDIQKITEVWFEVLKFMEENPEEAYLIMARKVNQTPEAYKAFIGGTRFFGLAENKNAFAERADDASLYGSGKTISAFYTSVPALNIKAAPDFAPAIEPRFIQAISE